jgi:hypothetical protein
MQPRFLGLLLPTTEQTPRSPERGVFPSGRNGPCQSCGHPRKARQMPRSARQGRKEWPSRILVTRERRSCPDGVGGRVLKTEGQNAAVRDGPFHPPSLSKSLLAQSNAAEALLTGPPARRGETPWPHWPGWQDNIGVIGPHDHHDGPPCACPALGRPSRPPGLWSSFWPGRMVREGGKPLQGLGPVWGKPKRNFGKLALAVRQTPLLGYSGLEAQGIGITR